jgi:hypothetical protein
MKHTVACLLKARIVKPAETAVAGEQLRTHIVFVAMKEQATKEEPF